MSVIGNFIALGSSRLIPMQVTFELTYRCNERCGHCYLSTYDDYEDGRLPLLLSEWERVIDQFAEAGSLYLVLMGGEAMMHPYFWEIAEYAAAKNFAVSVITNGLLLTDEAAARMARIGFSNVTLSLYSHLPELHDRMTSRKGSHQKVMQAIQNLRRHHVSFGVNCLLTTDNIDHYFGLADWATVEGIELKFDPLVTGKMDGTLGSTQKRATREQLTRFYLELKKRGGKIFADSLLPEDPVCNAGRGKAAVNVYGDLLTCLEIRESLGSLREKSFFELWASDQANQIRGFKNKDLKVDTSCKTMGFCDHCQGMARAESGDPMKVVPFQYELAEIKADITDAVIE